MDHEIPAGRDREFHEVFLLFDPIPPENLRLQREEVEAVLGLSLDAAERIGAGGSAPAVEYGEDGSLETTVSLTDFVPGYDGYLPQVAGAVRRFLAGEDPGRTF